ncbi:MAG: Protease HtpX-like protein [Candidatus Woesebacteria bacterium GW2011_GWA2_44_33]|nr:MAG: Protease HtpX-like protein [Candidatus Woesebacteria bacterium GW2011_GWA2_44_33]
MSIVAVLVGMVALLADIFLRVSFRSGRSDRRESQASAIFLLLGIIFAILSPIISQLIQLAVSRRREFFADSSSVALTRQPSGLISALEKIAKDHEPLEAANKATAHLYIVNPFKEKGHGAVDWLAGLFNTHPPLSERIAALTKMV